MRILSKVHKKRYCDWVHKEVFLYSVSWPILYGNSNANHIPFESNVNGIIKFADFIRRILRKHILRPENIHAIKWKNSSFSVYFRFRSPAFHTIFSWNRIEYVGWEQNLQSSFAISFWFSFQSYSVVVTRQTTFSIKNTRHLFLCYSEPFVWHSNMNTK